MADHAIVRVNENVVRRTRAGETPEPAPTIAPAGRTTTAIRSFRELWREVIGEPPSVVAHGGHIPRRSGAGI